MTQIIYILMIVNKNIFLTVDNDRHGLKKIYNNINKQLYCCIFYTNLL